MSLAEYMFDHNANAEDDQDILDEFLDQRVYDSMAPNTPVQGVVKSEDLSHLFPMQDDSLSQGAIPKNGTVAHFFTSPDDTSMPLSDPVDPTRDSEYLYVDPDVYRNKEDNTFTSSFDGQIKRLSPQDDPNSLIQEQPTRNGQAGSYLTSYDSLRDEVSKLKFGNPEMNPCPPSVNVLDPSYLDFSPATMAALPFKLDIAPLPSCSRVETQIKINLAVSPPPPQGLLHIPHDLISKNKFCLIEPLSTLSPKIKENLLYLDTYVLTSDLRKSCNICPRCIKREEKRASRRKSGNESETSTLNIDKNAPGVVKTNPRSWSDPGMMKKALIFNCKEIVSFPRPTGLSNDTKSLELSARIICYCRHHKDTEGFRLLFVLKNSNDEVVAKQLSTSIMIMDRKKNTLTASAPRSLDNSVAPSLAGSSTNLHAQASHHNVNSEHSLDLINDTLHPLSPNSVDESSEPTNTDTDGRGLKRKKLSIDDSLNTTTNPMFNDSMNGFSPVSNSDTNTNSSAINFMTKPAPYLGSQRNLLHQDIPTIQRIIPAQGPIRGGIEVTLLGFNFRPNLQVKFGANQALATHCWSETTIVTYLPPATLPGQVLVSFEGVDSTPFMANTQLQVFTYTDDTDRQLIELALQIVGLKMNGKLEDAKNIAKRIVGTDNKTKSESPMNNNAAAPSHAAVTEILGKDWFDSAQKAAQALTKSDLSFEEMLVTLLSLVDLPNCPIVIPNWQLCNKQGQALLHLASMKNYSSLIKFLIAHGCKVDIQDNQGLTPLFFASLGGHRELIKTFVQCKCNWNMKLSNDKHIKDYCDINILDLFDELQNSSDYGDVVDCDAINREANISKSMSIDSLNSMYSVSVGRHVSKMVMDNSVDHNELHGPAKDSFGVEDSTSEFADSEFESDDDDSDYINDNESDYGDRSSISEEDAQSLTSDSTISGTVPLSPTGLWQKVKNVFNNDDLDTQLPSYDDLFPFGPSSSSKPKAEVERALNADNGSEGSSSQLSKTADEPVTIDETNEDGGLSSDSSDDIVAFINHPRKNVENDKMLLFFWVPMLIGILALFFSVSVMGYKFEFIESIKTNIRSVIGDAMVGKERISRVFKSNNGDLVLEATRRMINEI